MENKLHFYLEIIGWADEQIQEHREINFGLMESIRKKRDSTTDEELKDECDQEYGRLLNELYDIDEEMDTREHYREHPGLTRLAFAVENDLNKDYINRLKVLEGLSEPSSTTT